MLQVIEQTDEEKFKMYMKCSKKKLIEMLIESNKHISNEIEFCSIEQVFDTYLWSIGFKTLDEYISALEKDMGL